MEEGTSSTSWFIGLSETQSGRILVMRCKNNQVEISNVKNIVVEAKDIRAGISSKIDTLKE